MQPAFHVSPVFLPMLCTRVERPLIKHLHKICKTGFAGVLLLLRFRPTSAVCRYHRGAETGCVSVAADLPGYVGGAMSVAMVAVQTARVWRRRDGSGLSVSSWVASVVCCVLWGVYGFSVSSAPQVVTNAAVVVLSAGVIAGILVFQRRWSYGRTSLVVGSGVVGCVMLALLVPAGLIGVLAVASSLFMNFPQVFLSVANLVRRRPTAGVSLLSFGIGIVSNLLWVGYGVLNSDVAVLVGCAVNLVTYTVIAVCTVLTRRAQLASAV